VHPVLAVVAVLAGMAAMVGGLMLMAPRGLRTALVTGELCLIAPGLLIVALSGIPLADGLGLRPVPGRTALLAALGGAALWAASLGLMNVQFVIWSPPPDFLESFRLLHLRLRPDTFEQAVLSVTAIAIMPALCEETLFRGIVLPSLARMGNVTALLGSAALFALGCSNFGAGNGEIWVISAMAPGTDAMCSASCPSDIDLSCGFHVSRSPGTRSSTRRVVCASCSSSCSNSSIAVIGFAPFTT